MRNTAISMWFFGFTLWVFAIIGWIMNIVKVFQTVNDTITGEFLLRLLGVVLVPLGAVLGYI